MSRRPAPAANGAAVTVARGLLDDVTAGVSDLAAGARDRALSGLTSYAHRMPAYKLLGVVLGRDVLTGTEVPRSAATLVGGFLELVPRGQEIFENLNRSGALERASAWFEAEVPKLGLSWEAIRALFSRAWDALDITDLADPAGAWAKIAGVFGPPLQALLGFARSAAGKVMEFVFEGALALAGGAGEQVMAIIRRAGDVLGTIVNDPVRFAGNLAAAVRTGLGQFVGNIGTHLQSGLLGWLTGALRGAVRIPARLDLNGIVSVVLDLLGLSWSALRTRLVRLLGERVVRAMETAVDWVQRIITGGLGAVVDKIMESATGLLDTVLGGIRDWVARSVVGAAVTRLISMFNPAGAVIQAIIAAYNTVQFFIERAQQLAAFATSVFDSIAKIAAGSIGDAANAVEQALARSVPVVLGFLARLLGLGDIAAPVRDVVGRVRGVVDGALDRVADWLASLGRRLLGRLRPGRDEETGTGGETAAGAANGTNIRRPGAGGTIATASVTAAGHAYTGRVVVAGGRLEVRVQRTEVKGKEAAEESAEDTPSPAAAARLREAASVIGQIEAVVPEQRGADADSADAAPAVGPEQVAKVQSDITSVMSGPISDAAVADAEARSRVSDPGGALRGAEATDGPVVADTAPAKGLLAPDTRTGTVWDQVRGTQPEYPDTAIPRSFEMDLGAQKVWVHPNATEHLFEYAISSRLGDRAPQQRNLSMQALLGSLRAAVAEAVKDGVPLNRMILVADWELKFSQRDVDPLPVLKHALRRR
ncbi:hypothetical protein [Parafrankia sp. EUN1f]|uniref:phage tail protein n=1 Tax=Parafrankia sp. EUN1f TaxID=102897 RepID=UPI0012FA5F1F|nr:hypothetical protein [Parafrankia sp. EUN1f]